MKPFFIAVGIIVFVYLVFVVGYWIGRRDEVRRQKASNKEIA